MKTDTPLLLASAFAKDVYAGLRAFPKFLNSKYFYDKNGDALFQKIMNLPEYYLTNCEYNIIENNKVKITDFFNGDANGFDLIELGAGDGKKTKILLRHFTKQQLNFNYLPIDISQNALDSLENSLIEEIPSLNVHTQQGMYFEVLKELSAYNKRKKIIMVLGSNIGNLKHDQAIEFLSNIRKSMNANDMIFIGFDQKKNPQQILDAYNDKTGITEAFNKNILVRINDELEGNFNTDLFKHWETYDPETGTAKSYLVATEQQTVTIKKLELSIQFKAWESIHTEISQKYDDSMVNWLAKEADLTIETTFADDNACYKNYLLKLKQ
ncbi:L-histidine N(alpha)-methyltransferase [Zhouia sp. PK063]|uniref:L-histidine N(alpha)-methyltransferase n=1 Tax=Zhouia sp. PK063 TaxID=3373602 RepID=UPI00378C6222